jgi:rod shape-determining protein MreC
VIARPSNRQRYVLALLLLTSITFITLDQRGAGHSAISPVRNAARDAVAPVDRWVGDELRPVTEWFRGIGRSGTLQSENTKLRQELADERGKLAAAQAVLDQNKILNELLHIPFVGSIKTIGAPVINTTPDNFSSTLILGVGSADGVQKDNPVVVPAGLVGRVDSVTAHTATVVLLDDADSSVGVRLVPAAALPSTTTTTTTTAGTSTSSSTTSTSTTTSTTPSSSSVVTTTAPILVTPPVYGVADGVPGSTTLTLRQVDVKTVVTVGELVVTSGQDLGRSPGDIPVGRIISIKREPGQLSSTIHVKPLVDFAHLQFVRVMLWIPSKLPS